MKKESFWSENLNIGNLKFSRFMSAPMDGITDSPMRQLIREFSPNALLFGQMRHVAAISNAKFLDEFEYKKEEHPVCFQISASETKFIDTAIEKILEKKFDMINLNIGCPAKKVVGSGCGSALMPKTSLLKEIIVEIKNSIKNRVPFTAKIRSGFKEKNGLEVALLLEDLGIEMLIIHPRLQSNKFTGELDFELVRKIKSKLKIPVIFSGELVDKESVLKTYDQTGVDGFMIGRALYGAPWKIKEIMQEFLGKSFTISTKEKLEIALKHLKLNSAFYGNKQGFNMLKKHIPAYISGIDGACQIRKRLVLSSSEEEMKEIIKELIVSI